MMRKVAIFLIHAMYAFSLGVALRGVGLKFGTHEPYYTFAWLIFYLPFAALVLYATKKEDKDGKEKERSGS